jgi:hypothetical protein
MRDRLHLLLLLGLSLPFLGKPVHIDDANFIAMARAAAAHPWTPHDFLINWSGSTERAFDVLSNPPGIAWWLAPVSNSSVIWQHLWMLPWLIVAATGAHRLGTRIAGRGSLASLLICGAPIGMLASHALTPDLPLLACTLWGADALLDKDRSAKGALVLGAGALFRYSALALLPLVFAWSWLNGDRRNAVRLFALSALPMALLAVHDLMAYGSIHVLAMTGFQAVSNGPDELFHKAVATTAAFGGAAVLPILCWAVPRRSAAGAVIGALVGLGAASWAGQTDAAAVATIVAVAAGGASFAGACTARDTLDKWLLLWLAVGFIFLLGLRFSAARYWIPFYAPVVLIGLKRSPLVLARIATVLTVVLSVALAIDDVDLATSQQKAAQQAAAAGPGHVAGHWGFQHHLTDAGWTTVEDDQALPPGVWVATSSAAWPQVPANECFDFEAVIPFVDPRPGLRVQTAEGGANIHGHMLAGDPPLRVFAPWSVG